MIFFFMSEYNPQKLREIRAKLNLKQEQMAKKAGLSQRDISLLENGKKEFIPTRYMRFLNAAGVNLNWLFDEEVPEAEKKTISGPIFLTREGKNGQEIFDNNPENITSRNVPLISRGLLSVYPQECNNPTFFSPLPHLLLPPDDLPPLPTRCFQLDDDSMANTLLPFDYIVGQQLESWEHRLRPGFMYVWVTHHDVLVRRFVELQEEQVMVRGDHRGYPVSPIPKSEIKEVWQVRARLSFQVPANHNDLTEQLTQIHANLETIREGLSKN